MASSTGNFETLGSKFSNETRFSEAACVLCYYFISHFSFVYSLFYSFLSKRNPFKITKIVLPSCPITPKGKLMNWKTFAKIKIVITDSEKTIFCKIMRFIFLDNS